MALIWKSTFDTYCESLLSSGTLYRISPHGSTAVGSAFEIVTAALLKSAGSIRLLANGARRATWRPALQAGSAIALKSPASIAAVGTKATNDAGVCRVRVP